MQGRETETNKWTLNNFCWSPLGGFSKCILLETCQKSEVEQACSTSLFHTHYRLWLEVVI